MFIKVTATKYHNDPTRIIKIENIIEVKKSNEYKHENYTMIKLNDITKGTILFDNSYTKHRVLEVTESLEKVTEMLKGYIKEV